MKPTWLCNKCWQCSPKCAGMMPDSPHGIFNADAFVRCRSCGNLDPPTRPPNLGAVAPSRRGVPLLFRSHLPFRAWRPPPLPSNYTHIMSIREPSRGRHIAHPGGCDVVHHRLQDLRSPFLDFDDGIGAGLARLFLELGQRFLKI